jgi:hypothetical protein
MGPRPLAVITTQDQRIKSWLLAFSQNGSNRLEIKVFCWQSGSKWPGSRFYNLRSFRMFFNGISATTLPLPIRFDMRRSI